MNETPEDGSTTVKPGVRYRPSAAVMKRLTELAAVGQTFVHRPYSGESDFRGDGLRAYARYRDLGVAEATGGLVQAHVVKMLPPCPPEARHAHVHGTAFQLMYVLKGWSRVEIEGEGVFTMHAGTCWIQPPRIRHAVLDYSDDLEVLEILLPADFETADS